MCKVTTHSPNDANVQPAMSLDEVVDPVCIVSQTLPDRLDLIVKLLNLLLSSSFLRRPLIIAESSAMIPLDISVLTSACKLRVQVINPSVGLVCAEWLAVSPAAALATRYSCSDFS